MRAPIVIALLLCGACAHPQAQAPHAEAQHRAPRVHATRADTRTPTATEAASVDAAPALADAPRDAEPPRAIPSQPTDEPAPQAATAAKATPEPAAEPASIAVDMRGFAHARGQVLVALWRSGRGFPEEGERAFGRKRTRIQGKRATVVFEDVPPGPFAVVVHHDEDRDFRMDTGLMGIPAEGYGFSRDASGNFGPPDFTDARLWLRAHEQRRVRIRMRY